MTAQLFADIFKITCLISRAELIKSRELFSLGAISYDFGYILCAGLHYAECNAQIKIDEIMLQLLLIVRRCHFIYM